MTSNGYIVRIQNVRKHPDPDTHSLQVGECFGNQVIVGLTTKTGDIGIYFPTDLRLSNEFLKANNLIRNVDPVTKKNTGGLFDDNGKVRCQKLRKEKSDGFFCPLENLSYTGVDLTTLQPGFSFMEINGHKICEKFVSQRTMSVRGEKKPREKSKFPLFHEHIDTEQLAYKLDELKDGMFLVFTEKLHGTSQRSANTIEETTTQSWYGNIINGIFKRTIIEPIVDKQYKYVCGTRRVVLKNIDDGINPYGYYGENEVFRKHAHDKFAGKLRKGETVYYEVVGYAGENTPIMAPGNNTKLNDKEFVKRYGKETKFNYGCQPGQFDVYVYRMTMTNEDGDEIDLSWDNVKYRCMQMDIKHVPELFRMVFVKNDMTEEVFKEYFMKLCNTYAEGESTVDPSHIREGIVVRNDGSKWGAWKHKSFHFKVLEDIIKLQDVVDIEEAQEV